MKTFHVTPKMLSFLGGVFYPTDHAVVMYPNEPQAKAMGHTLEAKGATDEVSLMTASQMIAEIEPTVALADQPLPSAGTEAATARALCRLAHEGHAGLLVPTPHVQAFETLKSVIEGSGYSMARRYGQLVIEDFEGAATAPGGDTCHVATSRPTRPSKNVRPNTLRKAMRRVA